jgi:hypothetical protein
MMDRLLQLAQAAPRAPLAIPLVLLELTLVMVMLAVLVPALFMHRSEPYERIMALLELILVRARGRDQGTRPRIHDS